MKTSPAPLPIPHRFILGLLAFEFFFAWGSTRLLAQYDTFTERQQAYVKEVVNNYSSALASPSFGGAEAFFMNGQPTQGLTIVKAVLTNIEASPTNWAGDLQAMISGMDCYLRYGSQWDAATQSRFQTDYTGFTGYSGETTSNLTMLAATIINLGMQTWGQSAFGSTVYSSSDPTGYNTLVSRIQSQVTNGMGEYASRPYEFYNAYPLLVLAQFSNNATLKNMAQINYEMFLAQSAGSWLGGSWAVATGRSYPDVMTQQPWGGAELMWLYFGGSVVPDIAVGDEVIPAAIAGYQPPATIVNAATTRTTPFTTQSAFNGSYNQLQSTYMTPNYAVFSQAVSPGIGLFAQVYPYGVMWNDSNTSHDNFLWITDPADDTPSTVSGEHTHGINGTTVQWLQNNGTFVMVRTNAATSDTYPYFLGYVPGGYQAMINDAANGRIYLYYNNAVMIAISSFAPFTWDPQGGIYAPSATPFTGDSQFHIPAVNYQGNDQACCALETASPTDFPGTTPAQQLAAFQAALQKLPLPTLTNAASPIVTYTDHNGQTLQKTYYGSSGANGVLTNEVNSINGVPFDYASWPQVSCPNIVQAHGGNLVTASGNQQTTYDLTNWVITTATVLTPNAPTNLTIARGNGSASLSWTASPTAMTYLVQRATSASGPFTTVQTNVVPSHVNDYGLTNGTTYYYQVAAVNNVGTSSYCSPVAVTPAQTGLMGTYYANLTQTAPDNIIELDPNEYFYWTTTFGNGLTEPNFSVQWTGWIVAPTTDTYTFYLNSQNGSDLKINGTTVINHLGNHPQSQASATYSMVAGQKYPIVIDYSDGQVCQLSWSSSTIAQQAVPTSAFYPAITTAPTSLTAQAASNAVTLNWTASPIATNYNVKRSTLSGSGYVTIASPASAPFIDNTAVNGTTYYYVVSAVDGGGESSNSSQVSSSPLASVAASPTGVSATAGNGQVSLTWTASAGATGYNLKRSTTGGSGYVTVGSPITGSFTDSTAANGITYYYVVTAVDSSGESANSSQVSATPEPAAAQQPTSLVATAGAAQVTLTWTASSGATSYTILRSTTSDSNFASIGTSTTSAYTDNTVVSGTTYYYAVAGINGGGQSNLSLQASATLIPNIPQNVVAAGGISQVALIWTASPGATSYNVKRSSTSGSGYVTLASPTSATYTDTSGTAGTTYYYVVTAVNPGGESAPSNQVSAVPEPPIASSPTGLIASPGNAHVGLSWAASAGATSYNVKRSTTSGSGYMTIGTSSVVMFTDSTALNGTPYYYVVSAVNGGGESTNSSPASATPQVSTAVLPAPWLDQDLNTGVAGSASYSSGVYTISASGTQIWSTTDGFHFIYRPLIGDGVMIARVKTGGSNSKTGIMMRQALTANSDYVDAVLNGGPNQVKTEYRATPGASAASASNTPSNNVQLSAPYWVKLVRTGNVFTAYRAPDGVTWTQTGGGVTVAMSDPIYVGLVQTSDSNATLATATFDNVTMLASPTNLSANPLSSSQLQLTWQNNPGAIVTDAAACSVERSLTGANSWTTLTDTLAPTSTSYLDPGAIAANTYDYRVACFNSGGISAYATVTATTGAITSSLTSTGSSGSVFSYQITADNSPNSFAATGLPNGLTLNAVTGLLSGTPTVPGNFPVIISATNTVTGDTVSATLTLTLVGPDSTDTPTMPPLALGMLALLLFVLAAKRLPAVSTRTAS